jgi:RHS repeat-associated protein
MAVGGASLNSIGYTGQRVDSESGLMPLGNGERYYAANLGSFIQQDSFSGATTIPQSMNRYSYAHNNPLRYSDRNGHWVHILIGAAIGFLFGAGVSAISQLIEIYEDPNKTLADFSFGDVLKSGLVGGGIGAIVAAYPPSAAFFMGLGLTFGAYNAYHQFKAGHPLTGTFEIAAALLPFAKGARGRFGAATEFISENRATLGSNSEPLIDPELLPGSPGIGTNPALSGETPNTALGSSAPTTEVGPQQTRSPFEGVTEAEAAATERVPSPLDPDFVGPLSLEQQYARHTLSDSNTFEWARDIFGGADLTKGQRSAIKARAIAQGLLPDVPFKPGTEFPDFEAANQIRRVDDLPEDLWLAGDQEQFDWLDARMPEGRPAGTTWHHTETPGRMELVPSGIHRLTLPHRGGRAPGMWADAPRSQPRSRARGRSRGQSSEPEE